MTPQQIDEYLYDRRANNLITSDNTVRSYRTKLMAWQKFAQGTITPELAVAYRGYLISHYNSVQVKQTLHILSCFYEATYDGPNPFLKLAKEYRKNGSEIAAAKICRDEKVMTEPEIQAMLRYAQNLCHNLTSIDHYLAYRNYFILTMLSEFGMRIDALVNINVSDIDLRARKLTIWASKNKKPYPVPIFSVIAEIQAYLAARDRFMNDLMASDALFLSKSGKRLSDTSARRAVNAIAKALGLYEPARSCHQIRHYRATKYHKMGMRHELISAIMGMSVDTLRSTYLHLTQNDIVADYEHWLNESEKKWVCPRCGYGAEKQEENRKLEIVK